MSKHEHRADLPGHQHQSPVEADEWDERYGEDQMWSGMPNEQLVVEVSELAPGTALDVGCGEGADAIWLAERGWRVTAIDVSAKALGRATRAAAAAGTEVEWRQVGLEGAGASTYDLVSVFYPALLRGDGAIITTLLDAVAPGGTLLVVHHAHVDRERAREHGFDPDDYVRHEDLVAALTDRPGWVVEIAEQRARTAPDGPGAHHHTDSVLRARRA
ncbi:class I SAM-dependent methyltransferase [Nocardioides piscis]|uniref:Methyltransferase domain-containing protein n=1 Tax=Nocardioides piscis TaxID=2714938 RepID=A0A6G7YDI5_9ACTN|nr:class I SAM-dependent methyltransferase [Nocardioides piscis]QIK74964.1 methyltransferase domain-containing protein [Nocardioides piscis]